MDGQCYSSNSFCYRSYRLLAFSFSFFSVYGPRVSEIMGVVLGYYRPRYGSVVAPFIAYGLLYGFPYSGIRNERVDTSFLFIDRTPFSYCSRNVFDAMFWIHNYMIGYTL